MTKLHQVADKYKTAGVVFIPNLIPRDLVFKLSSEVDALLTSSIIGKWNARFRYWKGADEIPERIEPIVDVLDVAKKISEYPSIIQLLTTIFKERPELFKDKLILKPPGGEGYDLHQDYVFYPFCNPDKLLAVAIALDSTCEKNGATQFSPKAFDRSLTGWEARFCNSDEQLQAQKMEWQQWAMLPGDAVIFHSLTPHFSCSNTSDLHRRILFLTYNAASEGEFYLRHRKKYLAEVTELGEQFK